MRIYSKLFLRQLDKLFLTVLNSIKEFIMNSTNVTESTPNSTQCHQRNPPEQCLILSENSFERKQNYIRKFTPNSIKCYWRIHFEIMPIFPSKFVPNSTCVCQTTYSKWYLTLFQTFFDVKRKIIPNDD